MLLDPERDAADIDWLRAWGATLLQTAGACCCQIENFNRCFIEALGREPGPRVKLMFRQLAEKNKVRMREQGACISTAELLVTVAGVMGVTAEQTEIKTEPPDARPLWNRPGQSPLC